MTIQRFPISARQTALDRDELLRFIERANDHDESEIIWITYFQTRDRRTTRRREVRWVKYRLNLTVFAEIADSIIAIEGSPGFLFWVELAYQNDTHQHQ